MQRNPYTGTRFAPPGWLIRYRAFKTKAAAERAIAARKAKGDWVNPRSPWQNNAYLAELQGHDVKWHIAYAPLPGILKHEARKARAKAKTAARKAKRRILA